jgi:hypothetical protein
MVERGELEHVRVSTGEHTIRIVVKLYPSVSVRATAS